MQKKDRPKYGVVQTDSNGYKYARDGWSGGYEQHPSIQWSLCLKHPTERLYNYCPYGHSRRLIWGLQEQRIRRISLEAYWSRSVVKVS